MNSLETLRVSRNDAIALLTDGEEANLLGAETFVADNPWVRDVGLVINFEAQHSYRRQSYGSKQIARGE